MQGKVMNLELMEAEQNVINAVLYRAYSNEANSGLETADQSASHDYAQDWFEASLNKYFQARLKDLIEKAAKS